MIKRPFREHHLLAFFEAYEQQAIPLDLALNHYFRAHKSLGSKDRAYLAETIYALVRWRSLLDELSSKPTSWETRIAVWSEGKLDAARNRSDIAQHIRVSFPKNLFDSMVASHGLDKACELCLASNAPAPTTVRANVLKTSREALLEQWKSSYAVVPCAKAPCGITFLKKLNFFELPEFKQGLFEVQDEGSQLLAGLVEAQPGQWVMDYCAGSGGKTLAFAPAMQNRGQIYLHDIRAHALAECRKRLRRAGIQNAQIVSSDDPKLKKLKKKMDWVLVDAPCSGTGTLRRNPDMKWKFSDEMLQRLVGQQRSIFERALSFVKPEGHIVYGTCSLLKEENEEQAAHFLRTYPLEQVGDFFQTLPFEGGMDGFFGVIYRLKQLSSVYTEER
ncbi:MAG: RsmB/NOP family class I SAM-dependent RNA methyltransferase [Parachlamydia sp.]|nr:RsmB/NOP family class I SAM-dependent RNA methyltransferase [Parachlamydia sp.]